MAISPASDLVLDVVRAADPADVQVAQEKLKANRASLDATRLADKGLGFGTAINQANSAQFQAGLGNVQSSSADSKNIPKSYQKFEAMVLQNFVKTMLPDSEEIYGKGNAGEIWKGMMAEQMGDALAKNGGVGIAEQMYSDAVTKARNKGVNEAAENGHDLNMATSMITDYQRKILGTVAPEDTTEKS